MIAYGRDKGPNAGIWIKIGRSRKRVGTRCAELAFPLARASRIIIDGVRACCPVIIPAYHSEQCLPLLAESLARVCRTLGFELVLVNACGRDGADRREGCPLLLS